MIEAKFEGTLGAHSDVIFLQEGFLLVFTSSRHVVVLVVYPLFAVSGIKSSVFPGPSTRGLYLQPR